MVLNYLLVVCVTIIGTKWRRVWGTVKTVICIKGRFLALRDLQTISYIVDLTGLGISRCRHHWLVKDPNTSAQALDGKGTMRNQ